MYDHHRSLTKIIERNILEQRETLVDTKLQSNISMVRVDDFGTIHSPMDRTSRKKKKRKGNIRVKYQRQNGPSRHLQVIP